MSFLWPNQDDRSRELLERSRKGDRQAFRSLYLDLYAPVTKFVGRRVRRREDAEDLVARVFHKLLERLGNFDSRRGSVRMFVLSIARNLVIDHVRAARQAEPIDDLAGVLADETGTPLEALVHEEELRQVRAVLLELPPDVREMLALHYGDGLRHAEIAALLGLEVAAVKQRFSRTLRGMRARLEERRAEGPTGQTKESNDDGAVNHVRI
jgi:RNA polymerase sigma-70 factor (ECF subfamily)